MALNFFCHSVKFSSDGFFASGFSSDFSFAFSSVLSFIYYAFCLSNSSFSRNFSTSDFFFFFLRGLPFSPQALYV
jgi:hypothetical protein